MTIDEILFDTEEKMEKAVEVLKNEYHTIRTGRASAGLVENIKVECYGSHMPLKQIANIGTPDPQLIVIRPFDPNTLRDIEKALLTSDLGLTPNNDGKFIRIPVPPLSEERRKQIVHSAKNLAEDIKISIRNIRRDANKAVETEEKEKTISEDESFNAKEEVQKLTKEYESKVEDMLDRKTKEIMEI